MLNKRMLIAILISILSIYLIHGSKPYCDIPKECQVIGLTKRQLPTNLKQIICRLNDDSRLRFNQSIINKEESKSCQLLKKEDIKEMIIKPKKEYSLKLKKGMIDYGSLVEFTKDIKKRQVIVFEFFSGFQVNLFDEMKSNTKFKNMITFMFCTLDFYSGEKLLKSCQDFQEATNSSYPRSIFQLFTHFNLRIVLEGINKLCPLAFKEVEVSSLHIFGDNSFNLKRLLTFSPERYEDMNAKIEEIQILINNVDLNFDLLHPSVFKSLTFIFLITKVNTIHPDLFLTFKNLSYILLKLKYTRSLMHKNGIEWIKNINKDVNCDLNNITQISEYVNNKSLKFIHHDAEYSTSSSHLREVFPDEDFCLYKDFPINQLVVVYKYTAEMPRPRKYIGCTYLWITRSYKDLAKIYTRDEIFKSILDSEEYKSISRCNFDEKLKLCNRSNFEQQHLTTPFEISQIMTTIYVILNILSYIIAIIGLVSNILIIITISSKINEADFKEIKQYDYLRLNSIGNCIYLLIHFTTWLHTCIFPYQVFCPLIRKTVFMQYFNIIVQNILMTALEFMNSFTYIGFAFNRISLIGKDHNKLVKFMCELSIKTFVGVALFISIGLSVVKFFQYDINHGYAITEYPIEYDYISSYSIDAANIFCFIMNFISDILNNLVLVLVNLAIDIGMIIKLKQTLNERFEKFKEYSTVDQQEKKKKENENAIDNAISMIIWNSSLNFILKLPNSAYSLLFLSYDIYRKSHDPFDVETRGLEKFIRLVCFESKLCKMYSELTYVLYLISISVQFFFYRHYDKKLNSAIKKRFGSKKK